jgi:hypothetical protein
VLGRPKKENERKGERKWASRPKGKNGRELGKRIIFPSQFSNFIFKWFLNHFEFWIKTTQQNKRIAAA